MFCAFCTTFLFTEDSLGVIVNSFISDWAIDPKTDKFENLFGEIFPIDNYKTLISLYILAQTFELDEYTEKNQELSNIGLYLIHN